MEPVQILPVTTAADEHAFWAAKDTCLVEDIIPNNELCAPLTDNERAYFLSAEYREQINRLCTRETDRAQKAFFELDGVRIGFCLYCTYLSEDGKCFILDFCLFPDYRGHGLGKRCFSALRAHTAAEGAVYFELNTHSRRSMFFWQMLGFGYNGYDRYGSLLMLLPPQASAFSCAPLEEADLWQLLNLENGYKMEIGEPLLTEEQQSALESAVRAGRIQFFAAKRETRVVGICSVSRIFSTFSCTDSGVFEDFFVEPAFRAQGCARLLTEAAQKYCVETGITSLQVGCADVDVERYRHLGFDAALGKLLVWSGE